MKNPGTIKLLVSALIKFGFGLILVGLLIFLPAGTLEYPLGWLFVGVLFLPMFLVGLVMVIKSPEFLKKRLDAREKRASQKGVLAFSALMFVGGFVVAGLDFRFGWSVMPLWVSIAGAVLFLIAYGLYGEVMRENTYLSRTIGVEKGQKVVDTGLYGIVRHPMYSVTILLFLMIPVILGSWYALAVFAMYPVIIILRIVDEEKLLTKELPGYAEYKDKVRYRLIPFIW